MSTQRTLQEDAQKLGVKILRDVDAGLCETYTNQVSQLCLEHWAERSLVESQLGSYLRENATHKQEVALLSGPLHGLMMPR